MTSTPSPSPTATVDDEAVVGERPASRRPWRAGEWNRAYLITCAAGLITDPLFFYALSVSGPMMCLFIDGWFAVSVTVMRCMVDALHVWNMLVQLREECGEKQRRLCTEEGEDSGGKRRRPAVAGYLKSKKGLVLDLFVVLPVMQTEKKGRYVQSFGPTQGEISLSKTVRLRRKEGTCRVLVLLKVKVPTHKNSSLGDY